MPTYENTRAGAYQIARYAVLPALLSALTTEEPFHLRTEAGKVFDHLIGEGKLPNIDPETVLPDNRPGGISMRRMTLWWVDHIVRGQGLLERIGEGWWRNRSAEEIDTPIEDEVDAEETGSEHDGWIYAFSFPALVKQDSPFHIKIGKAGDVDARVADQTRGSAFFERPIILGRWKARRVSSLERAIHGVLNERGRWLEQAPGLEWFMTTVVEIEEIIEYIQKPRASSPSTK